MKWLTLLLCCFSLTAFVGCAQEEDPSKKPGFVDTSDPSKTMSTMTPPPGSPGAPGGAPGATPAAPGAGS
jgi:hypothetical protein